MGDLLHNADHTHAPKAAALTEIMRSTSNNADCSK
jgi:hypothetical protein